MESHKQTLTNKEKKKGKKLNCTKTHQSENGARKKPDIHFNLGGKFDNCTDPGADCVLEKCKQNEQGVRLCII